MKESSSNALNMVNRIMMLHQQDSLDNDDIYHSLKNIPLHIYMICRSPVITIDLSKIIISDKEIAITFNSKMEDCITEIELITDNDSDNPIVEISSEYPYKSIKVIRKKEPIESTVKASLLFRHLAANKETYFDIFNLEVLYVGQAFGKNGSRITIDRLRNHEKAQQIFFDTQEKYPDYEIWFVSMTFEASIVHMFQPRGRNDISEKEIKDGVEKHMHILENPITTDQQINVVEACLIKYFNTYDYNKTYMNFPSYRHKSYLQCYELDLNSVLFELSSESIYSKLYSRQIESSFFHLKSFFLHSDINRKNMFEFFLKRN